MIEVRGATKHYGEVRAVDGVDLAVTPGEIFGLIGHNGAGKSTLFKMMLGLVTPDAGEIHIEGQRAHGELFRQVRRRLGYLPENIVFYDNLTGLETLRFFAALKGAPVAGGEALLERVGLGGAANRRLKGYSKGMRQRLGLAQALLGQPKMLFLDEPTTGLDPEGIREFYEILKEQRRQGTTIILTSHILAEIQERVDRLAVMKNGKIHALGSVQSLREAMDLPLRISLRLAAGAEAAVRTALGSAGLDDIEVAGETLSVSCPREAKIAALSTLAPLFDRIGDLQLHEPSLEDVFLGYSERTQP
ncbi:MAG: ABC transporter ATP-binding protein [Betaproteobacteria bacterium]